MTQAPNVEKAKKDRPGFDRGTKTRCVARSRRTAAQCPASVRSESINPKSLMPRTKTANSESISDRSTASGGSPNGSLLPSYQVQTSSPHLRIWYSQTVLVTGY